MPRTPLIAFALYGDLSQVSGGFLYDQKLIEGLRSLGATVEVVPLPWPHYARGLLANAREPRWPRPLEAYDALIQDELAHPSFALLNRRLRSRVPVVSLIHNLTFEQPSTELRALKRFIEGHYLANLDGIIAVCEATAASARNAGASCPSTVVYAGVDHLPSAISADEVVQRAHEPAALRVLFLAQVHPHKGLHRLVRAVAELPAEIGIEVHVVGSTSLAPAYVRRIEREIARLSLWPRFVFHGELHGEELAHVRRRMHVLALPSDREAYPLSCLEAHASGLPTLVTDQGGTRELVRDGTDGRLIAPDDLRTWAAALAQLANERVLLARMGQAALLSHRVRPTWNSAAQRVLTFLSSLQR